MSAVADPTKVWLPPVGQSWTLRYGARPFTLNGERKLQPRQRAELVREWRDAFGWAALEAKMPKGIGPVLITAVPYLASRKSMQDAGGCFPAAKAAIDGLVDVDVLAGDGPDVVHALTLMAPVVDHDGLVLVVQEVLR